MNRPAHCGRLRNSGMGIAPLTDDEIDDIYLGALEVLEQCGIAVQDDECMDILADAGCRVDRETRRVRIAPEIVEDAVNVSPARVRLCGRDPKYDLIWEPGRPTFTPFLEGVVTIDLETGAVRESTKKDVGDICRLVEFLPEYDFPCVAVTARDAPIETGSIHGWDAALRNTTKGILIALMSRHETETVIKMAEVVAGGPEALAERPIIATAGSPVAPLHFNKSFTDFIIPSARAHIPTMVVSMGLVGATMPVNIAGTMVIGIAEELAGLVLIQACERGCPALAGQSTCGFDMRSGLASVGGPEMALVMAATAQIGRKLRVPSWTAGL
jgi:trimethylamine---corrinoid protein Co-methyltransferase